MKKLLLSLAALIALPFLSLPASSQATCKYIAYGTVLTPAQWQYCFTSKADTFGYVPVNKAGDTMLGKLITVAPNVAAGFNIPPGLTPSAPVNGDVWSTSSGVYAYVNGSTVQFATSSGGILSGANGGTGVANTGKTITIGANITTTGAGATTLAFGASTQTYTFPTTTATIARTDAGQTFTGANTFSGTLTTNLTGGGTQCAQVSNTGVLSGSGAVCGTAIVPTRQVLTSGSGATYTTPANVRQLRIRMVVAGGGGASNAVNAVDGTGGGTASFNGITAIGGNGGHNSGNPSPGGSGGNNTPTGGAVTGLFRMAGAWGSTGVNGTGTTSANGGNGASSVFGGGAGGGNNAPNNSGSGGGGAGISSSLNYSGSGGAAGEYVEFIINAPVGTYLFTVPAGGTGGTFAGNGGSGVIIVDEFY